MTLLDEEETRNQIHVAGVGKPHEYALLGRVVAEPKNGVFLTNRSFVFSIKDNYIYIKALSTTEI